MDSKLRQQYFKLIQELKEKEDPVEESELFTTINSTFKKYSTDSLNISLEAQKDSYALILKFQPSFLSRPYQRTCIIDERVLFQNLFIELRDTIKTISVQILKDLTEKDDKDISLYLKNLKEGVTIIEEEVNKVLINIPTMKTEIAFPLLMLEKIKEDKIKSTIPEVPGRDLPFYDSLNSKFKKAILSAVKTQNGSWEIKWNLPISELLRCPDCGAVSPFKVTRCPACGLNFD